MGDNNHWTLLLAMCGILYAVNIMSVAAADYECDVMYGESISVTNVNEEVVTFNTDGIETKINPTKGWMTKSDGKYKITYSLDCRSMVQIKQEIKRLGWK